MFSYKCFRLNPESPRCEAIFSKWVLVGLAVLNLLYHILDEGIDDGVAFLAVRQAMCT